MAAAAAEVPSGPVGALRACATCGRQDPPEASTSGASTGRGLQVHEVGVRAQVE